MREVIAFYRLVNLLSIDVVAGATVCSLFFAKIYNVNISFTSLIVLGLTVWIIYTVDRLLDVRDAKGELSSERHRFHKRNKRTLTICLMFAVIINLTSIYFLPIIVIKRGIFLSGIVIIYILFRRRLLVFKEFFVALLYTAGVMVPSMPDLIFHKDELLPVLQFFFIALLNLIVFSFYERKNDLRDHQQSIATILPGRVIRALLKVLFIAAFLLSAYTFIWLKLHLVSLILLFMTFIHLMIFLRRDVFDRHDHYRLIGDAIFLTPTIYLLL